jgi:hypothetical protein
LRCCDGHKALSPQRFVELVRGQWFRIEQLQQRLNISYAADPACGWHDM